MSFAQIKTFASALIVMSLLLAACSKNVDSETVAYQFVRLYFIEDNMAEAVKLASGSAKANLEGFLREIEAVGAKEPAKDKPLVKATMLEMKPTSDNAVLYIYRITSEVEVEVEGMEPITAKLWLSKEGNVWRVSKFVQEE
jgi:hypothetical protein